MGSDEGWVTDPEAIDIIVGLGAVQVGDQIRTVGVENYGAYKKREGQIATVSEACSLPYSSRLGMPLRWPWGDEPTVGVAAVPGQSGSFHFCRKNIAAWRRPT